MPCTDKSQIPHHHHQKNVWVQHTSVCIFLKAKSHVELELNCYQPGDWVGRMSWVQDSLGKVRYELVAPRMTVKMKSV